MSGNDELNNIIVKKVKKVDGGHHGGAWKVAYADFVTAMMAFFLLLWLLNVSTQEQLDGIADYFQPSPMISSDSTGAGGVLGGTTMVTEGAMISEKQDPITKQESETPALRPGSLPPRPEEAIGETGKKLSEEELLKQIKAWEDDVFKQTQAALEQAMQSAEMKDLQESLSVDMTPEGLRIQIIDQEDKPLFTSGSAVLQDHTKQLLRKVSSVILKLPNELSVRGHTDSVPYGPGARYTNWELSADRANSSRRFLQKNGIPATRVNNVVGKADTDHLFPDNPRDGRNRRISIILLHEHLTVKEGANMSSRAVKRLKEEEVEKQLYKRTEGSVSFP
ncbi:MAG: flagellar motor protein MotB [Alphaproteobacteria bacterium]|nr:flagellar motor protein MotB [Alphaproteobacteria bacterium]